MDKIIELKNVSKNFGKGFFLDNISFSIGRGEIVGYLGPNGAGKTTTIKLLMNAIKKDSGSIYFKDKSIEKDETLFRKHIGYMPENGTPFEFLTAREYLEFVSGAYGIDKKKIRGKIDELLSIFSLTEEKKSVRTFSKGMKQKLLFLSAIIHNPDLLILDEPFNAIEPQTAMLMKNLICEMKQDGKAVIFSSHVLEIVEKLADKVILLNNGKIVGEGFVSSLKSRGGLDGFFRELIDSSNIDENTVKIIQTIKS